LAQPTSEILGLANIGINLAEIVGVAGGFVLIAGSGIAAINRFKGFAIPMLLRGIAILSAGLLTPVITGFLYERNEIATLIVGWLLCIPIVIFAGRAYVLPAALAKKRNLKNENVVFLLNCLFFVPLHVAWLIAMFMATKKDPSNPDEPELKPNPLWLS
jgi:hypothetical protein